LVQASACRWLLDAKTGLVLSSSDSPLPRWPRPPIALGDRVCLVPDGRHVLMLDAATGKALWSYAVPGETTRSGEPPLVVPAGGALVVVEPLNLGYRLQKLDGATGKPLWPDAPLLDLEALGPAGWVAAGQTLYHAGGNQLSAWSLSDGERLWRRPLPAAGPWRLERDNGRLLACRDRAAAARFRFRWLGASLQWHIGPLPAGDAWSVFLLDAGNGGLIHRVALEPEAIPRRAASGWNAPPLAWPALSIDRDEAGAPGPVLVRDHRGIIAAVGNRVVSLAVSPSN
jgi:hypothetical protein